MDSDSATSGFRIPPFESSTVTPAFQLFSFSAFFVPRYPRTVRRQPLQRAFTLIELIVVVGIISLLMVLVVPAFTKLSSADAVTNAAYTITGALQRGRNYAMSNNTYVWVGFYEEDTNAATPTDAAPPYPGRGRILIGTVASIDGTKIFDNSDPSVPLPSARIKQVGKLVKIEGVHLTDIGAPPDPTPIPTPAPNSIAGRPALPYTEGASFSHFNRISSDTSDTARFVFTAQNYTFYKAVRFTPRGEANINGTYTIKHAAEIALLPTHGNVPDAATANVVAIQFTGISGNFEIYRR